MKKLTIAFFFVSIFLDSFSQNISINDLLLLQKSNETQIVEFLKKKNPAWETTFIGTNWDFYGYNCQIWEIANTSNDFILFKKNGFENAIKYSTSNETNFNTNKQSIINDKSHWVNDISKSKNEVDYKISVYQFNNYQINFEIHLGLYYSITLYNIIDIEEVKKDPKVAELMLYQAKIDTMTLNGSPPPPPPDFVLSDSATIYNGVRIITSQESGIENYDTDTTIWTVVQEMPTFPAGENAKEQFIYENLNYPALAKKNNIQGKVYMTFVVEKNGELSNIRVLRNLGGGCDDEAVRIIKLMPAWKPGKINGSNVRVQINLPINFYF